MVYNGQGYILIKEDKVMKGYVRNKSSIWRHAMKRSVGPGERIPLEELYEQYGLKHDIEEGESFIDWLRYVKLKDINVWEIKYEDESTGKEILKTDVDGAIQAAPKKTESKNASRQVLKKESPSNDFVKDTTGTVEEIVNFSVRQARERLPRLTDQKTLKYALHTASTLANKDTLCRMLKKRIQELDLITRT